MYYIDENNDIQESIPNKVYRYFGGDSNLVGRYVSDDTLYDSPEEAKSHLSLSNVDWNAVNTAIKVAECQIDTTRDGNIVNLDDMTPSNEQLKWNTVVPVSDYPGGGMEYALENDWDSVVQVLDEKTFDDDMGMYVSDNNPFNNNNDMIEIDDELYNVQMNDVEDSFKEDLGEEDFISDSDVDWQYDVGDDAASIDDLIADEIWENQAADDTIYDFWGSEAPNDDEPLSRKARASYDEF